VPDRIVYYTARIAVLVEPDDIVPDAETDIAVSAKEGLIEYGHNVVDIECAQE
jgi:hypothetical protein